MKVRNFLARNYMVLCLLMPSMASAGIIWMEAGGDWMATTVAPPELKDSDTLEQAASDDPLEREASEEVWEADDEE